MVVIFFKMCVLPKIKTSPARPGYYSYEHAHSKHISSTSHFSHLLEARADKKNDPWCLPVILVYSNLTFMKIHILMKFWDHMSFSATYFFDSKNGPQPLGVRQAAPAYPQVYGKIIGKSPECSNFSIFSIWWSFRTKCPLEQKLRLAQPGQVITLTSMLIRSI